jgi:hypothetical protein
VEKTADRITAALRNALTAYGSKRAAKIASWLSCSAYVSRSIRRPCSTSLRTSRSRHMSSNAAITLVTAIAELHVIAQRFRDTEWRIDRMHERLVSSRRLILLGRRQHLRLTPPVAVEPAAFASSGTNPANEK